MNVLIACDKFKSSLTATEVCQALADGIHDFDDTIHVVKLPLADGGDGTLAVLKDQLQFSEKRIETTDPLGRHIDVVYLSDGGTAYIELAEASGIQYLDHTELDILHASTQGTGIIINEALRTGHTNIVLSIGGSCTNDLGIGILDALGFQFLNSAGKNIDPIGANLLEIADIKKPDSSDPVQFTILCDVENLLYGKDGAAAVYGPQKGASSSDIEYLEKAAKHFSTLVEKKFQKDIANLKGGGAAGGIASGLYGLLDSVVIQNGFDFITEKLDVKSKIEWADLVITGEGKFDSQSLQGKVVGKMIELSRESKTPIWVVAGVVELAEMEINQLHLDGCYVLSEMASSLEDSMQNASKYLKEVGSLFSRSL